MKTIALYLAIPLCASLGVWSGQLLERRHMPTNEQMISVVQQSAELGYRCHGANSDNTLEMCRQAVLDLLKVQK